MFYVFLFQVACFSFLPFPERSIMRVSGTGHSCAALGARSINQGREPLCTRLLCREKFQPRMNAWRVCQLTNARDSRRSTTLPYPLTNTSRASMPTYLVEYTPLVLSFLLPLFKVKLLLRVGFCNCNLSLAPRFELK